MHQFPHIILKKKHKITGKKVFSLHKLIVSDIFHSNRKLANVLTSTICLATSGLTLTLGPFPSAASFPLHLFCMCALVMSISSQICYN